jgi:hypothetical protein
MTGMIARSSVFRPHQKSGIGAEYTEAARFFPPVAVLN